MIFGIDVSSSQKLVDWGAVAKSGLVEFAYARAFHSPRQGEYGDDVMFINNHDGCKAAGTPFGAYFFISQRRMARRKQSTSLNLRAVAMEAWFRCSMSRSGPAIRAGMAPCLSDLII